MLTKHIKKLKKVAAGYKSQGYKVRADIKGHLKPLNIRGRRADVVAIKGRDKVLVEVETRKSMTSDKSQRKVLRGVAKKYGYRFRTVRAR